MESSSKDVTQWLLDWNQGDRTALDRLMPLVYDELHRLAAHHLRPERSDHTLQATTLVRKTYLDLVALDDALTSLSAMDPQKSRIVELRFFGGLTVDETAEVLGVSPVTVYRAWAFCGKRLL